MKPNYQLLEDRICIRYKKPAELNEEKTASGIILQKKEKDMHWKEGEVYKVGDGKFGNAEPVRMHLKVGDTIVYRGFYGDPEEYDGYDGYLYRTMRQHEVVAVVMPEED